MILIKIDSLSTQELINIALDEGIMNAEKMEREDLINELKEIYEVDEDTQEDPSVNRRFLFGITDYRDIDKALSMLPGVEALPQIYPVTGIHLMYKNPFWGYVYWSVSPSDMERLEINKVSEYKLSLIVSHEKADDEVFEFAVNLDDYEWNVGLPAHGGKAICKLMCIENGKEKEICRSNSIDLIDSYWLEHVDEIKYNDSLFRLYLSMDISKDGDLAEGPVLKEIVEKYRQEDAK